MLLKSFLQMMNGLEPLFWNWTGRRKGTPKFVDETHQRVNILSWMGFIYTFWSSLFIYQFNSRIGVLDSNDTITFKLLFQFLKKEMKFLPIYFLSYSKIVSQMIIWVAIWATYTVLVAHRTKSYFTKLKRKWTGS